MEKRREDIDTFRGIACVCIVLFHYGIVLSTLEVSCNYFAYGNFAVDFFFILSAFYLYQKTSAFVSVKELLTYRMVRLYSSYWVSIFITSACMVILDKNAVLGMKEILINCTMLQQLLGVSSVDGVYWTLTYELILLVSLALLKFRVRNKTAITDHFKYCTMWLIFCIISRTICKAAGIGGLKAEALLWGSEYVYAFIIGISVCHINTGGENKWKILCAVSFGYPIMLYGISQIALCKMAAATIGYLLLMGKLYKVKLKLLAFIGKMSYEVYLLHNRIGKAMIQKLIPDTADDFAKVFIIITAVLFFIIAISFCVNKVCVRIISILNKHMRRR